MRFIEFLQLVKVVKMLYGRDIANNLFVKNIHQWYDLDNESLSKYGIPVVKEQK